jgi:hypothetical protein
MHSQTRQDNGQNISQNLGTFGPGMRPLKVVQLLGQGLGLCGMLLGWDLLHGSFQIGQGLVPGSIVLPVES